MLFLDTFQILLTPHIKKNVFKNLNSGIWQKNLKFTENNNLNLSQQWKITVAFLNLLAGKGGCMKPSFTS